MWQWQIAICHLSGQNQKLTKLQQCYNNLIDLSETFKGACLPAHTGLCQKKRKERRSFMSRAQRPVCLNASWGDREIWAESLTCLFRLLFTWKCVCLDQPGEAWRKRIRLKQTKKKQIEIKAWAKKKKEQKQNSCHKHTHKTRPVKDLMDCSLKKIKLQYKQTRNYCTVPRPHHTQTQELFKQCRR